MESGLLLQHTSCIPPHTADSQGVSVLTKLDGVGVVGIVGQRVVYGKQRCFARREVGTLVKHTQRVFP